MGASYEPAPDEVVDLARELIDLYHEDLEDARIGFLLRDKAPSSDGRTTLGAAKKLPAEMRAYLKFDFIIWVAKDYWRILEPRQRRALLDHELCHCTVRDYMPKMRGHDLEEFNCIIERYGFWRPFSEATLLATQRQFGFLERTGSVAAADPSAMDRDVLDQVEGLLDGEDDGGADDDGEAADG